MDISINAAGAWIVTFAVAGSNFSLRAVVIALMIFSAIRLLEIVVIACLLWSVGATLAEVKGFTLNAGLAGIHRKPKKNNSS